MTKLEQVARAIFDEERPDDSYDRFQQNNADPQKYERLARAAVEALRDVPVHQFIGLLVTEADGQSSNESFTAGEVKAAYVAVLDAILSEKPDA